MNIKQKSYKLSDSSLADVIDLNVGYVLDWDTSGEGILFYNTCLYPSGSEAFEVSQHYHINFLAELTSLGDGYYEDNFDVRLLSVYARDFNNDKPSPLGLNTQNITGSQFIERQDRRAKYNTKGEVSNKYGVNLSFTPYYNNYNGLVFDLIRASDFRNPLLPTERDTVFGDGDNSNFKNNNVLSWRKVNIDPSTIKCYRLKNLIGNETWTRVGIQGPPGTQFCLNNEGMKIGNSGFFEISDDLIDITSLCIVPAESGEIVIDYIVKENEVANV